MKHIKKVITSQYFVYMIFAIKILFYYTLIDLIPIRGAIGVLSFLYIVLIFYCFSIGKGKYNHLLFTIAYTIITFIMFADAIYFRYFNQLTSINQIWQMSNLVVVNEGVKFAMPPISILLFIDIPVVLHYFKKVQKFRVDNVNVTNGSKPSAIIVSILLLIIIITNPIKVDAVKKVNNTEFFSYHLYDIVNNTISKMFNSTKSIDEVLHTIQNNVNKSQHTKYYGIAKNKNLIVIQMESVQDFVIGAKYNGQEITPNLNKLIEKDSFYFNNYYQTIGKGNTSDAEFSSQNSFYPVIEGESYRLYEQNEYEGLPWLLRGIGYKSIAIHGYKGDFWNREAAYVKQGFEDFYSEEDLDITETVGFGLTDKEMFKQASGILKGLQKPFYSFIITLTNHFPYQLPSELVSLELLPEDNGTVFGNYIQSVHYTDQAIGEFITMLQEEGLYDNSIIALYGDHHGLNCKEEDLYNRMTDFLGYPYDFDEMLNIPLIINIPNSNICTRINTVGGQVDFMPTIANLMGIRLEQPFVFGQDLINAKEGFVASVTYMFEGSFIKDGVMFELSREGTFENSRALDINTKQPITIDGLEEDYKRASTLVQESKYVLDNDLIKHYKSMKRAQNTNNR